MSLALLSIAYVNTRMTTALRAPRVSAAAGVIAVKKNGSAATKGSA
jgi:hypothetical protein